MRNNSVKELMNNERKTRYKEKEYVTRKWLSCYGELSEDNDIFKNQNCIREIFNMLDIIFENCINSFRENNVPEKIILKKNKKKTDKEDYVYKYPNVERIIDYDFPDTFNKRAVTLINLGYQFDIEKLNIVRDLRNTAEHGNMTVFKEYIELDYEKTKQAMLILANVLVSLGMLDEKYESPSFEDLRVKEGDTLRNTYVIKRKIGEGGMSRVYESVHPRLNRKLAIKELKPNTYYREIIKNECMNLVKLNHSQIPHIYDTFSMNSTYYIVMDYIEGETLQNLKKILSYDEKMQIILSVCGILEYLHDKENNMIYVDLKPENIMVDHNKIPYLIDFGISSQETNHKTISLTVGYAAPEAYRGELDKKSDIYSLGCVMRELFGGEQISSELNIIISKCLEEEPINRYEDIGAVKKALNGMLVQKEDEEIISTHQHEHKVYFSPKYIVLLFIILFVVCTILLETSNFGDDRTDDELSETYEDETDNVTNEQNVYISDMQYNIDKEKEEFWCYVTVYNYSMSDIKYEKVILHLLMELSDGTEKSIDLVFALPKMGADDYSKKLTTKTSFQMLGIDSGISITNVSYEEYQFE